MNELLELFIYSADDTKSNKNSITYLSQSLNDISYIGREF
ncbi:hypothetical protein HNR32_002318 [Pectinatus brassicae]|uniref:Uncharacterized protein n=1 Tax=Pectinatus brassicae TaxID=862415 RepID=A0A840UHE4_9FIRM|nr:hypothetical protein [Pectinatus brassicae]